MTEGTARSLLKAWNFLDAICLLFSALRLILAGSNLHRTLLSFSSLRVFMLVPRFPELKLLFESVLRALPNVVATMVH